MAYEGFRIPNTVAAAFAAQSKVFDQDHEILADGARGNGIVYGVGACQVLPQAAPNMTVRLTTGGTAVSQGTAAAVTTGNVTIAAAHATLPRIDIVSVTNAGVKVATAGTPATAPLPPVIPQSGGVNNIVLAFIYVPPADTAIGAEQIIDKRVFVNTPGAGTGNVTTTGTPSIGNLTQFSGGTSITNGNLSGDVTTAGGLTTTIAADAVTYAKVQNVSAASRLLGRGSAAGAGDPQELTLGTNLSMSGTVLNASGSGGTVPTGTGFPHITGGTQDAAAKLVDTADINNAQVTYAKVQNVAAASRLLGRGAAGGAGSPEEIVLGTNLSMSGTTLNASGSGGTVPTGTGFTHITAGAQDAAAKLVDTADVNNAQVTYAKIQNVSAASRLLGRGSAAGAGSPEELILGTNLTMSGTTLNAAAGTGGDFSSNTAVSVDGEVVVFSGTLGKTGKRATGTGVARLASGVQSAAELSGDVTTSGSNAATIAANAVSYAKIQDVAAASRLLGRGSAAGAGDPQEITLGTNLSMSGTTLNATGGGGSSDVTVALAADVAHATNSTTLTDVTGLTFPTSASPTEIWRVDVCLLTNANAAAASTAKFKFGWTFPAGVTGFWASQVEREVGATVAQQPLAPSIAATLAFAGSANVAQGVIQFTAMIASNGNAGAVQLQFAQNATAAGAIVTIKRMSSMIARKVAA